MYQRRLGDLGRIIATWEERWTKYTFDFTFGASGYENYRLKEEAWWVSGSTYSNKITNKMVPSIRCNVDERCVEFAECGRLSVAGLD